MTNTPRLKSFEAESESATTLEIIRYPRCSGAIQEIISDVTAITEHFPKTFHTTCIWLKQVETVDLRGGGWGGKVIGHPQNTYLFQNNVNFGTLYWNVCNLLQPDVSVLVKNGREFFSCRKRFLFYRK